MRLLALATVLLFAAGSAIACPAHPEHTASNDQTTAQGGGAKKLPQSQPGKQG
jgi:hypothetical protein